MDSQPDDEGKAPPASEPEESPSYQSDRRPKYLLYATVTAAFGVIAVGLIQSAAPATDHQMANIFSVLAGMIAFILVAITLQLWAWRSGQPLLVPGVLFAIAVMLVGAFQFDGFSGEMWPQFKFRFARNAPELRSVSEASRDSIDSSDPSAVAIADSLGFLGNERTGVIHERLFSIPNSAEEVQVLWDQGIGQGWSSFAVASDRAVTLEQRDDQECVTCYRLADGELIWIERHEAEHFNSLGGTGPRSTPTIHGGRVFAQGATGKLWCLDLETGDTHWSVDLLELAGWDQLKSETAIAWGRAGSPLIVDGLCVVPYGGPDSIKNQGRSLIALDAETGEIRWTSGEDQISYASPALMTLAGVRQIVSVNEKTITGHAINDGTAVWSFDWPGQSNGGANCAMVIPAGENQFLIGKGYGGGSALVKIHEDDSNELHAEAVWDSTSVLKTKFTHACVDGDVAYAISNGSLEAVTVDSGDRRWIQPRSSRFGQGQILLVADTIVAQSESGDVAMVDADPTKYSERVRLPALSSKTWNIPTVAGRHLLVRNDRQAICFLLPPVSNAAN